MQIENYKAHEWWEVHTIIAWKEGKIFRTKFKGYAKKERPIHDDEIYTSLSTKITKELIINIPDELILE